MWAVFLVFVGGGLGAVARHTVGLWLPSWPGTLVINLAGCFALGVLASSPWASDRTWVPLLGVGLLGGFTTYSTFNLQLVASIAEGRAGLAFGIAFATLLGGVLAGAFGLWAGSLLPR
jgi:CrcB protein